MATKKHVLQSRQLEKTAFVATYVFVVLLMAAVAKTLHLTGLICLAFVPGLILPRLTRILGKTLSDNEARRAQMIGFAGLIAFVLVNLIAASK